MTVYRDALKKIIEAATIQLCTDIRGNPELRRALELVVAIEDEIDAAARTQLDALVAAFGEPTSKASCHNGRPRENGGNKMRKVIVAIFALTMAVTPVLARERSSEPRHERSESRDSSRPRIGHHEGTNGPSEKGWGNGGGYHQ